MSGRDPGPQLVARLVASATDADCGVLIETLATRDWASATFVGHRHAIALTVSGAGAGAWIAGLVKSEWPLGDHFIADLIVHEAAPLGDAAFRMVLHVLTLRHDGHHAPSNLI